MPPSPPDTEPMRRGEVSHWWARLGGPPPPRPALRGQVRADVCIVGAGYTGLWTAWYLTQAAPGLRVTIVERDFAGFGASGRNGGWLTGGFAWAHDRYLTTGDAAGVRALVRAMEGTVDEVIAVARAEGIAADIHRTDELMVATNPAQLARARAEVAHRQAWGETRITLMGPEALAARIAIPGALGALAVGGVARVQPAALVAGLAAAVERRGVTIHEGSPATALHPGRVDTPGGQVLAPVVIRATEGFTPTLPGLRRDWLPLNSAQVVTEPLPAAVWVRIGWHRAELLGDMAHAYFYAQRTADGRIALGGRGVPYRYGSALDEAGAPDPVTVDSLVARLRAVFPAAAGARIDHAWCGVLAVPRDWCATVGFDPATGLGWA
ncbi:MAG: FAD-dependent oxidoreductase, partial [Rhodobacterales bacterium]|nr:FAD-dependent oxidoreductase [Rhodobacterales bacterium]